MADYANDTNIINASNVELVTVEVTLPAGTESIDTVEVTLSDSINSVIGTAPGGNETSTPLTLPTARSPSPPGPTTPAGRETCRTVSPW